MVSIIEVTTKRQLRQFVEYPNILYKDVPQFVPATFDDDMSDWDKKKNPAFEYCEARCWLAMRSGEMVGRIGAILSHKANHGGALGQGEGLRRGARPLGLYRSGPGGHAGGGLRPAELLLHLL
mgnify:CR=1 FL=1